MNNQPQKPLFFSRKIGGQPLGTWCLLGFVALMILGVIFGHDTSTTTTASSTPAATVQATSAPTQAPAPTDTPATSSIDSIVQNSGALGIGAGGITDTYDTSSQIVKIRDDWANNDLTQFDIKDDCFQLQKALWTSGTQISEVDIAFTINTVDDLGNKGNSHVGECDLKAATEAQFHWDSMLDDGAWSNYDVATIDTSIVTS